MGTIYPAPELSDLHQILDKNDLPTSDLADLDLNHFFSCGESPDIKGVVGVEVYGSYGLLRSLAVDPRGQGQGVGKALLEHLYAHARSVGISDLYLLTETAETYFERQGFEYVSRALAPEVIKQTREFSSLCPDSAAVMRRTL
ncbi:arsenic resistance N-acetyltransferase ArsN2 [Congregibacter brevis]|uniref:Arsenic resistance N-acetyltransferase ArsN2 n=1 Tax=Congregibacter brevis TaxID=3081201 RepID=A0ABZ0IBX7_9GAMM|nr:arsenic resistance N-acetyltransferase ArsN2 [Congregibacter sp. IMCC45268]